MNEERLARRKAYKRYKRRKRVPIIIFTFLLAVIAIFVYSFNLDNGTLSGVRFSQAKSMIDTSSKSEELRDARIDNYYEYLAFLEEEARAAAELAEQERLEQELLQQQLAAEQEFLEYRQNVENYVEAIASGEKTSDAMSGITFRRNTGVKGKVALSFDDGPFKTYTYKYLDILKEYGARASFFCQAQNVKRYPEQTQAIVDAGCEIGCHSYAHAYINKMSNDEVKAELDRCLEVMSQFQEIRLFRYPYGAYNSRTNEILQEYNMISVLWSVDPQDWATDEVDKVVKDILDVVKDGDIILLHEGKDNTLEALPKIITGLQDMGFEIVTVSELLYADQIQDAEQTDVSQGSDSENAGTGAN